MTMPGSNAVPLGRLSELEAFTIVEGIADVRGWSVFESSGAHVGVVHDLLFEIEGGDVRYLDVAVLADGRDRGRHVLLPLGLTQLVAGEHRLTLPLVSSRLLERLPAFDHGPVSRPDECVLLGRLMGLSGPIVDAGPLFYAHAYFSGTRFHAAATAVASPHRYLVAKRG